MRQLDANLNFISSLPDEPTITTAELKAEFDKAGNTIKEFINTMLEPDITNDIASSLATAKNYTDASIGNIDLDGNNITYNNSVSGLNATTVQEAIDEVYSSTESASDTANEKIKYTDFDFSSGSKSITLAAAAEQTGTVNLSKQGYYPLGIIGSSMSQNAIDVKNLKITSRSDGAATVSYKAANSDYGNQKSGTLSFDVLWVKIS